MAKNEMINLSLEEIIARGGPKFRQNRRGRGGQRFGGGAGRGGRRLTGFRKIPVISGGGRMRSLRAPRQCIVNVSNLGPQVTTADLQELFANHSFSDVSVQYLENGSPSGTAVVLFKRFEDGMRLKREFTGVKLDGRVMDLYVTTSDDSLRKVNRGRISKALPFKRLSGGMARRRLNGSSTMQRGRGRGNKTIVRKPVSNEELDRELDAYMRGSKHAKIVAP